MAYLPAHLPQERQALCISPAACSINMGSALRITSGRPMCAKARFIRLRQRFEAFAVGLRVVSSAAKAKSTACSSGVAGACIAYTSGSSQRRKHSPHRMRNICRASSSSRRRGMTVARSLGSANAASISRMAFGHLREPRGTMACTPRSNIRNTVLVSYMSPTPYSRPLDDNTAQIEANQRPNRSQRPACDSPPHDTGGQCGIVGQPTQPPSQRAA